jgi:hypothetical protein
VRPHKALHNFFCAASIYVLVIGHNGYLAWVWLSRVLGNCVFVVRPCHPSSNIGVFLCDRNRKFTALCMSEDHKPTREDEAKRIRDAGGFVINNRVMGELAVSRAFGDVDFKKGLQVRVWQHSGDCCGDRSCCVFCLICWDFDLLLVARIRLGANFVAVVCGQSL